MKEIIIGTKEGTLHPCEVEHLKKDIIGGKYYLYFFDRVLNDYCYVELVKRHGRFYAKNMDYRSCEGLAHALGILAMPKEDIADLPPLIPFYKRSKQKTNELLTRTKGGGGSIVKRVEFLELQSYCNALRDEPIYYYFIVNDMSATLHSFKYNLTFTCKSEVPLKKNIIARHKTTKVLDDFEHEGLIFGMEFFDDETLDIDHNVEKALVRKIMELESDRRKDLNPILLTKIVRMILAQDDYVEAAREYQGYLEEYYDKWIREEKYKQL